MHSPIFLKNISLSFLNKNCFTDFSTQIYPGSRIAIIGRNGSGKSSLLDILRGALLPSAGAIVMPRALSMGYVEQTINYFNNLSGGQRLNKRLSQVLAQRPDVLLLDEPTNHLDKDNRKSLMHMLKRYSGTLIIVSHDTELLRHCIDRLWHIDNDKIHEFSGSYDDYRRTISQKRVSIEKELKALKRGKNDTHQILMKEQKRAAKSKARGEKNIDRKKWPTIVSKSKALKAEQTSGRKKTAIDRKKQHLTEQLSSLQLPDIIVPKFSLTAANISADNLLSISNGAIGYSNNTAVLKNIHLSLSGNERIAIQGKNASGKSTLLKAILGQKEIFKTGRWYVPHLDSLGYLDQHYSNLNPKISVMEHIKALRPDWNELDIRRHLNSFLFRKNNEVMQLAAKLSGGEKARVSLSLIAAKTPRLLILDEITNNLDLETKEHVTQVLKKYPGAMLIVSHDEDFLQAIGIDDIYELGILQP